MSKIEFVYFDLGNVILEFDHQIACQQIGAICNLSAESVWETLFSSGQVEQYDKGVITSKQFHLNFCNTHSVDIEQKEFLLAFSDIFAIHQPIVPLLLELKQQKVPIGILSNTCPAHWDYAMDRYPILSQLFDVFVLSFQENSCKPDSAIYEAAAREADRKPSSLFFMDDREENVQGALRAGLDAVLFRSATELRGQLLRRGFRM